MDSLTSWQSTDDHLLAGATDTASVGVFGHSTGGGAVLEFCMNDSCCQIGIPLDSWLLPVSERILPTPPRQPMLFINSPRGLGEDNQARGEKIIRQLPNDVYQLTIAEHNHYDFSDLPQLSPYSNQIGLSGKIDSNDSINIQNTYLLEMIACYLKNKACTRLMQEPNSPEVLLERRVETPSHIHLLSSPLDMGKQKQT